MTTKSIFDFALPLTRAALLRLVKGETVDARGNPAGTTMVEGVCKAKFADDVTEAERRAIGDALTRDVPGSYRGGYAVASWGDPAPVVGTTEWLTMIASNADRIAIQVQRGPNTWEPVWLADATPEQQKEAMRTWLEAGQTPTWERMPVAAHEILQPAISPITLDTPDDTEHVIDVATGSALDAWGSQLGITRDVTEIMGVEVSREPDGSYRVRLKNAWRANRIALASGADALRRNLALPPAPPPPLFKAPTKTPTEEARDKIGFIRWLVTESQRVGSPHSVHSREWDLLKSCEMRLNMGETISDKQGQWLDDIYMTAKRKGLTISHLLPPIPKFS